MNIPALIGFVVATAATPGPNNIIIASAGARRGVRATLPMVGGIAVGISVMLMLVALGVGGLFAAVPIAWEVARWVAIAWLLVMAWRIARAGAPGVGERRRMGFLSMALFQWVNPKAWLMTLGAAAAFTRPDQPLAGQAATIALTFAVASVPCVLLWSLLGASAARLLSSSARVRAFNVTMAVLLVASMVPVALGE